MIYYPYPSRVRFANTLVFNTILLSNNTHLHDHIRL